MANAARPNPGLVSIAEDLHIADVKATDTSGEYGLNVVIGKNAATNDNGVMSSGNSSGTPLAGGGTFTGTGENVENYSQIILSVYADVASATDGLEIYFSRDDVTYYRTDEYTISAGQFETYTIQPAGKYHKVIYKNGASAQSVFSLMTSYKKAGGVVSSHRVSDRMGSQKDAQLVQNVNKALRPDGYYYNINSDINGNLNVKIGGVSEDAGARVRVSQLTTLGDYKILNYDHTLLWENAGTGTGTYSANKFNMAVTAGQWYIKNALRPLPYFSGKSQAVEMTFDNFQPQEGVVKRCGYFSSSAVSPFSATLDGFWLESDGATIRLKASRAGTETLNVPITEWTGYDFINSYADLAEWKNFTVVLIDFLWLGGAVLRLWLKTQYGFVLAHIFHYSSTAEDVFILSPNQPLRYEIVSTTGAGSFRYICAQVATEGSTAESGLSRVVSTGGTAITLATAGTVYPLKAIRKGANYRTNVVKIEDLQVFVSSSDNVYWSLQINPTLSAPLTYAALANSAVEHANGDGTITVTGAGTIIAGGYLTQNSPMPTGALKENFLAYLGGTLANVAQEYVLCVEPITTNVSANGMIATKEY